MKILKQLKTRFIAVILVNGLILFTHDFYEMFKFIRHIT